MIGIPCRGENHQQRVVSAIEKLTPDVYDLLMQAIGISGNCISYSEGVQRENAIAFQNKVNDVLALRRKDTEVGDIKFVWLDHRYTETTTTPS